jgi:hypothetical protein
MPKVPLIESHAWLANSYANAAARVTASERMEDFTSRSNVIGKLNRAFQDNLCCAKMLGRS